MKMFIPEVLSSSGDFGEANLRKQVKSQGDGRSQNRRLMKGLPV